MVEEVRITKLVYKGIGAKYEVCFVLGLLNTHTHHELFSTLKDAREFVKSKLPLKHKLPPVIVQ